MKRIEADGKYRTGFEPQPFRRASSIHGAIAHVKQNVLTEFAGQTGEHTRILRLALNEAEALAWQTDHPHLFFPALAAEKAHAALTWHRRQRALRGSGSELAFAE
jgi:hypothetical protein